MILELENTRAIIIEKKEEIDVIAYYIEERIPWFLCLRDNGTLQVYPFNSILISVWKGNRIIQVHPKK